MSVPTTAPPEDGNLFLLNVDCRRSCAAKNFHKGDRSAAYTVGTTGLLRPKPPDPVTSCDLPSGQIERTADTGLERAA